MVAQICELSGRLRAVYGPVPATFTMPFDDSKGPWPPLGEAADRLLAIEWYRRKVVDDAKRGWTSSCARFQLDGELSRQSARPSWQPQSGCATIAVASCATASRIRRPRIWRTGQADWPSSAHRSRASASEWPPGTGCSAACSSLPRSRHRCVQTPRTTRLNPRRKRPPNVRGASRSGRDRSSPRGQHCSAAACIGHARRGCTPSAISRDAAAAHRVGRQA